MSILSSLAALSKKLEGEHQSARERWAAGGEGGDMEDEVKDGVLVQIRYEGANRNTDYRTVLLDGYHFARECETVPWSFLKEISVCYDCFTFLTQETLQQLLEELGLDDKFDLQEEWYPADDGVVRYNCVTRDFDAVIPLWKAWKERYMEQVEAIANEQQN